MELSLKLCLHTPSFMRKRELKRKAAILTSFLLFSVLRTDVLVVNPALLSLEVECQPYFWVKSCEFLAVCKDSL